MLAQFREPRARETFLRFFSPPGEESLDLTGDMVTEHGAAILASVCGGDPAPLLQLAQDESVNEFVRGQAIDGLLVQAGWGEPPREAVIEDLRRLFHTLPKPGDAYVWAELVCTVCDFNAPELVPEARRAFAENLVDESVIGLEELDQLESRGSEKSPLPRGQQPFSQFCKRNAPIVAVNECAMWLCFRDDTEADAPDDDHDDWDELDQEDEDCPDEVLDLAQERPPTCHLRRPYPSWLRPKWAATNPAHAAAGRNSRSAAAKNETIPHSALRIPHSALRTPHSALRKARMK